MTQRRATLAFASGSGKLWALNRWNWQRLLSVRAGLALVAGITLAAAFPKLGFAGGAWLAPGLMLLAGLGAAPRRAFRLGYVAGLAHYLASLYWLLFIPFPTGAVASWLALSAFMALYPACWVWLCCRLLPAVLGRPDSSQSPTGRWAAVAPVVAAAWTRRAAWCLLCACLWVALELLRAWFLGGFPWSLLGVSQYQQLPLIQVASVTGVYGVSFMVAWLSLGLLCAGVRLASRAIHPEGLAPRAWRAASQPGSRTLRTAFGLTCATDLALPLAVLLGLMFAGAGELARPGPSGRALRVALVQPSIPQRLIFDPKEKTNRFKALIELSRLALAAKPDLLVWPEGSLPGLAEADYQVLTNLIATQRVWMVFGADDAERLEAASGKEEYDYYNSAFLFDPQGRFAATYRKRRLVIFGEFVPLARWAPFLRHLTPVEGGFTPGTGPGLFALTEPRAKMSVLICFEDVFPGLARDSLEPDTDFLLNLTNNGWFGESAAQWQHAACAVFRAIENGLPLVRCANNGLTCWVDARGRLRDVGFTDARDVYSPGFKIVAVPLLPTGARRTPTFYQRHGDWFGWSCAGASLLAIGATWRQRQPGQGPTGAARI